MRNQIKKIVLIGPESTGKTTLAQQLASYYETVWVQEYAREYIAGLNRLYEEADLLNIAKGQIKLETKNLENATNILVCDTDLIVIEVWATVKYGRCADWILKTIAQRQYDLYLLCGTDVTWEDDPQREHPSQREELYEQYLAILNRYKKKYIELVGNEAIRLQKAINAIDDFL